MAEMQTPTDLKIQPRDISFRRDEPLARWWLGGDPIATAFYNALSASFPQGERFFMDAVRPYRDTADFTLRSQIAAFMAQEAVHSREHLVFNNDVAGNGYDFSRIDDYLKRRFDFGRKLPRLNRLSATIGLEHFTAILAHALLAGGDDLAGAPEVMRRMWHWHAIEEIEHKAVAYDTFLAATQRFSANAPTRDSQNGSTRVPPQRSRRSRKGSARFSRLPRRSRCVTRVRATRGMSSRATGRCTSRNSGIPRASKPMSRRRSPRS